MGTKALYSLLLIAPGVATADVVTEWNEIAVTTVSAARVVGTDASRIAAIVHAAVFDAANAVEGRYTSYRVKLAAPPGSSAGGATVLEAHSLSIGESTTTTGRRRAVHAIAPACRSAARAARS